MWRLRPTPNACVSRALSRRSVDSAESLSILLSLSGHEAAVDSDGKRAVAVAEAFRPPAVLLEIGLPKLDGYQVSQGIRAWPWANEAVFSHRR